MASRLWFSLCLVLFAHNLIELVSDRHLLSYKIVEKGDVFFDEDDDLSYLVCTPFLVIKDEDSLYYEQAIRKVSVKSFLNHSIASIQRRLNVTSLFRLNESHIFNGHVCFPTTKSELEEEEKPFNEFLRRYGSFLSLFIYSKEKQPNFYERAYEKDDGLSSIYIKAYKQKVFGPNHLVNADCSNRTNQIHHDRFSCLNRCFMKLKMKSSFYRFDDEGTFDLSEILEEKRIVKRAVTYESMKLTTPSAIEGAEDCLRKCPESGCFWEVVIPLKIDIFYYQDYLRKKGKEKIRLQLNTYAAFYSMDDFYLQLFSLLAIFTGTSVLRLLHAFLSLATQKIESHLKNEKLLSIFRLAHPKLKFALALLSFVLVLIQSLVMVHQFRFHSSQPNKTSSLNFSSEPFSVVFCFPIENLERDKEMEENRNWSILRKYNFTMLEDYSKKLLFDGIEIIRVVSGGDKPIQTKFTISNEVFFKSSKFDDKLCLSRCFRLDFDLNQRRTVLSFLWIGFATKYKELFLIEKNQSFTSDLVNFRGFFYPQKVTKKHSPKSKKSNCRDYSKEPNCDSRRNCFERCLSTKFIERHGSIPTNTVVRKSDLPLFMLNRSIYFNETTDKEVQKECSAQFNQTDCNEVRFEESPDRFFFEMMSYIRIRLSYMNIVEREMEYEPVKILLDIVGLETIFFGSNVLGVLTALLLTFSRIFRLKWYRAYSVFLFLVAAIGFFAHNVLVFRSIISGELSENEFFEKPERYTLPSPILCFPIGRIDENHRVTGEYLDHLTDHVTFHHIFLGIRYNNRTHVKSLHISRLNFTKNSNFHSTTELELTHFYYLGLKCFKISLKVSYKEEDFLFQQDKTVLRIFLNRPFPNRTLYTFFLHQQADSSELGGGFAYRIGKCIENVHCSYETAFELFRIVREDQFELIKDPRRLLRERVKVNDVTEFQDATRERFKEDYNLTTDDVPLDRHFDISVDNELFNQYRQIQNISDKTKFKSLDFEQNVANTYTNLFYSTGFFKADFSFSISPLVRRVVITNRENYTKLVVSVLNTLALWLEICILDMGAWLSRLARFALRLYRLLIRTRNLLKTKI